VIGWDVSADRTAVPVLMDVSRQQDAFTWCAARQGSAYKVVQSNPSRYEVKCTDESCSFDFRSYRHRSGFRVARSKLVHSASCFACPRRGRTSHIQQLSSSVLAFAENATPRTVQLYGVHDHGIQTSYATARRSLIAAKKAQPLMGDDSYCRTTLHIWCAKTWRKLCPTIRALLSQ